MSGLSSDPRSVMPRRLHTHKHEKDEHGDLRLTTSLSAGIERNAREHTMVVREIGNDVVVTILERVDVSGSKSLSTGLDKDQARTLFSWLGVYLHKLPPD